MNASPPPSPPDSLERAYLALRSELRGYVARRVAPSDVDDLVQETFLRIQEHSRELVQEGRVVPWAFRIARSVVVDHLRRKRPAVPFAEEHEPVSEEPEPELNAVVARSLGPLIAVLPDPYRVALERTELGGLDQRALALELGLTLSGA